MRSAKNGWAAVASLAAVLPWVGLLAGCSSPPKEPLVASAANLKVVTLSVAGMT